MREVIAKEREEEVPETRTRARVDDRVADNVEEE